MNYNEQIKQLLDDIIADMNNNRGSFVKNPDKDFTRDRKLLFEKVISPKKKNFLLKTLKNCMQ